jgi:hypothetical protein
MCYHIDRLPTLPCVTNRAAKRLGLNARNLIFRFSQFQRINNFRNILFS